MSISVAADLATYKAKTLVTGHQDPVKKSQLHHKIGQEVAQTLSEMKGPLMKVGQIFSQLKDVLPPEVSAALGQLRQYASPVDIEIVRAQIRHAFGADPEQIFLEFDEKAYRSASLGQVHLAQLKSGERVVVKVQYPDVADACESDLKHLKTVFRLLPLVGVDSQSLNIVFLEIQELIIQELDYLLEAQTMQQFYDFFSKSDLVVIPKPIHEYCSKSVLTMTYEQGESLESTHRVRAEGRGDPEFIQTVGKNLFYCLVEQIFRLQYIHVDPHAGNFAVKPDGRIVVYDFGAVKKLDSDAVLLFKELVEAMLSCDVEGIEHLLHEKHIRREGSPSLGKAFYGPWLELLNEPFLAGQYNFVDSTLHTEAIQLAKSSWKLSQTHFLPSRDTLLLDRLIVGHYWNFVGLKVQLPLRELLEQYVTYPGIDQNQMPEHYDVET